MPYSHEHKQRSRKNILHSAIKLFTQKGFENTSIDEIMLDADLTRGTFYAHFNSKSELYQESLRRGALSSRIMRNKPEHYSDEDWFKFMIKSYLSTKHVKRSESPCPLAFLATDIAVSEPEVQATYAKIYQRMNKLFAKYITRFSQCDTHKIYAITAMMIGAVTVGRSISNTNELNKLLNGCETTILGLLEIE